MRVWRLGHKKGPCDYVPRHLCGWQNRFDDPLRQYRTLYCAKKRVTCLREVLADLRPNPVAIRDFIELFGSAGQAELCDVGVVSTAWRRSHALARAEIRLSSGQITNIDDLKIRRSFARTHFRILRQHGVRTLTLNLIRSRFRELTQSVSRVLFNEGSAGVRFRSRLDHQLCFALFEGRSALAICDSPIPMTRDIEELTRVCAEYALVLRTG